MGRTTSKKMIPLLLLRILWIHADKDHMISMEYICDRLEDEFESERRMGRPALRKLVSSNIRQLNLFFHETQWCLNEGEELQTCEKAIANPEQPGGYIKVYCLNDRLFSDTEIRMLHDSILFSPGVDDGCARRILDKLKRCASKYFGSRFEYKIDIAPECMQCLIPKLVLQPMIENSVKYGFGNQLNLHVELKAYIHEEKLMMICRDDGVGMSAAMVEKLCALMNQKEAPGRHSGLYNIHRRIQLLYGYPYGVEIRSLEGHGTTLVVTLPAVAEKNVHSVQGDNNDASGNDSGR